MSRHTEVFRVKKKQLELRGKMSTNNSAKLSQKHWEKTKVIIKQEYTLDETMQVKDYIAELYACACYQKT